MSAVYDTSPLRHPVIEQLVAGMLGSIALTSRAFETAGMNISLAELGSAVATTYFRVASSLIETSGAEVRAFNKQSVLAQIDKLRAATMAIPDADDSDSETPRVTVN